ncbi:hypothetical protein Q5O24_14845 [Eubacteriaceae bacterium ES3]|nr:hypothetical protein Q5O24_14845 [Eubacteriaceae bacterium ES3]
MNVSEQKLDRKKIQEAHTILIEAFKNDPLYKVVFLETLELNRYLKIMLQYYNRAGRIIATYDQGQMVAVSLWMHQRDPFFSLRKAVQNRMAKELLIFGLKTRFRSLVRMIKEAWLTERYHDDREHHYLFMIASIKKGGGSALLEYAEEKFDDCPIYLENSNVQDNWNFYERHDFHLVKRIDVMGVYVDLLTNRKGD